MVRIVLAMRRAGGQSVRKPSSVRIDAPALSAPIFARLVASTTPHFVHDRRKVQPLTALGALPIHCVRRSRGRHRDVQLISLVQYQLEVLAHQPERKLRREVIVFRTKQLALMSRRYDGGMREHFEHPRTVEPHPLAEGRRLGNRLHVHAEDSVHDQLHRTSRSMIAHVKVRPRERAEDGHAALEDLLLSASEQNQCPFLCGGGTARDGDIEDLDAALACEVKQRFRRLRRNGAHFYHYGSGLRRRQHPSRAGIDFEDRGVVRQAGDDDLGIRGERAQVG